MGVLVATGAPGVAAAGVMVIAAVEPSGAVLMVTVSPLRIALMGAVRVSCTVVDWFVVNVFYAAAPGYDARPPSRHWRP